MSQEAATPPHPPSISSNDEEAAPTPVTEKKPTLSPPPDGGLQAWLIVAGAFASNFCTFGYLNSFGAYQAYYSTHILSEYTSTDISWIGSLQIFLLYLGGAFSGPLSDRYGVRAVLIPASVTMVFSVMMNSLCHKYYQVILAQGVLGGLATGCIFTPSLSVVGQYFLENRALAMGITLAGGSLGGVIFPIILNQLLNFSTIGFGWTVRIIGFIMLALLGLACIVLVERVPRRKNQFFLMSAFSNKAWLLTNSGVFLILLGLFTPIFYISSYAKAKGMALQLAFYETSILNAASIFGRTIPGALADRFGRFNTLTIMVAVTAILEFCWIATENNTGITVFAAFYGFFSGSVVSLYPSCIAQVSPSPGDIATYVGMGTAYVSLAGLAGTPITGTMVTRYGSYTQAAIFSGVVVTSGAFLIALARLILRREVIVKI